jgi:3-isopropylmalate dehydrogenase
MTKKVAVLGGDGIGPEVVAQGVKVIEALRELRGWKLELTAFDLGADRYLKDGTTYPNEGSPSRSIESSSISGG